MEKKAGKKSLGRNIRQKLVSINKWALKSRSWCQAHKLEHILRLNHTHTKKNLTKVSKYKQVGAGRAETKISGTCFPSPVEKGKGFLL